jgi:hypothetical protein
MPAEFANKIELFGCLKGTVSSGYNGLKVVSLALVKKSVAKLFKYF